MLQSVIRYALCSAVMLGLCACGKETDPSLSLDSPPPQQTEEQPAAQHSIKSLSSVEIRRILDETDCPVVVSLWASWCRSARDGTDDILPLQRAHQAGRLRWIFLCFDTHEDAQAQALPWLRARGLEIPVQYKSESETDAEFLQGLSPDWSGTLPATLVCDKEGKVVALHEFAVKATEILDELGLNLSP